MLNAYNKTIPGTNSQATRLGADDKDTDTAVEQLKRFMSLLYLWRTRAAKTQSVLLGHTITSCM